MMTDITEALAALDTIRKPLYNHPRVRMIFIPPKGALNEEFDIVRAKLTELYLAKAGFAAANERIEQQKKAMVELAELVEPCPLKTNDNCKDCEWYPLPGTDACVKARVQWAMEKARESCQINTQ